LSSSISLVVVVDFAGDTVPVTGPETGDLEAAARCS
jgi:hypothetical protein